MRAQSWTRRPVFSASRTPVIRLRLFPAPVPSRVPTPRQRIPGITQGFCFLGYPTPLLCQSLRWVTCSAASPGREPQGVTPFRVPIFRDLRTVLYAVSLIRIEWIPPIGLVGGRMGTCPVWACLRLLAQPSAGLAGSNSRRFRYTFVTCP